MNCKLMTLEKEFYKSLKNTIGMISKVNLIIDETRLISIESQPKKVVVIVVVMVVVAVVGVVLVVGLVVVIIIVGHRN